MKKVLFLFSMLKKFKLRHLRLGIPGLLKLAKWHVKSISNSKGKKFKGIRANDKAISFSSWAFIPPSFSILITVFNQTQLEIERALQSARAQKGAEIKIKIIDDGSYNEETLQFLKNLQLNENEDLFVQKNAGVVNARNFLIDKCDTDFLVFLDPDDSFQPNYIESAANVLQQNRSIEILFPNVLVHDAEILQDELWVTGPFDASILKDVNTIPMSSVVTTRLMKSLGGYSIDFESGVEDWDLWYRASLSNAVAQHLPIIGYTYTKALISRTTYAKNNKDFINLRQIGPHSGFELSMQGEVDILLFVPFLPRIGGVEKYIKTLLEDFEKAGFNVALVVTESAAIGYEDNVHAYQNLAYTVLDRNCFQTDSLFVLAISALSNSTTISVNFGSPWAFLHSSEIVEITHKNVCFVFNTEISLQRAIGWENSFDEFWVAYEGIRSEFPEELRSKVVTIYTGVIQENESVKRAQLNGPFRVGFLGRLSPEKNPALFLRIAKLAKGNENFHFKVAGEGPLNDSIRKECQKLPNVDFLGYMEDPFEFLIEIDCLMITSETEGIPLAAMEALSVGVPVISTNVGGMKELILTHRHGYVWNGNPTEGLELLKKIQEREGNGKLVNLLDSRFSRTHCFETLLGRLSILAGSN
jgi:glycosyltransferase involved in cell wall biosynthesis